MKYKHKAYVKGIKANFQKMKGACFICGLPLKDHAEIVDDGLKIKCFVQAKVNTKGWKFGKLRGIS